jgi:hypothetical protein
VGEAFKFDGVSNFVTMADSQSLAMTNGSFTIEGWINILTGADVGYPVKEGYIFDRGNTNQDSCGIVVIPDWDPPYAMIYFGVTSDDGTGTGVQCYIAQDEWQHIAAVYDEDAQTYTLYINGQTPWPVDYGIGATNPQFATNTPADDLTNASIGIGNSAAFGPGCFPFCGLIDELSVYSRALMQNEIQAIYYNGSQGKFMPNVQILSQFSDVVSNIQQIQVEVTSFSLTVDDLILCVNGDPMFDLDPVLDTHTGIYTFTLDTSVLPNGASTIVADATFAPPDDGVLSRSEFDVNSAPANMTVINDISFGDVYDGNGNLIQEGAGEYFGATNFAIRASAIHYDSIGNVLPIDYTITISDSFGTLRTLTGSAQNGLISVGWDLTDSNGNLTTDTTYNVSVSATWYGQNGVSVGTATHQYPLIWQTQFSEYGGWCVASIFLAAENSLASDFATICAHEDLNHLLTAGPGEYDAPYAALPDSDYGLRNYGDVFNLGCSANPPATKSEAVALELLHAPNWATLKSIISGGFCRNLIIFAHGTSYLFGACVGGDWDLPGGGAGTNYLSAHQVHKMTKNTGPFRFVFVNGCASFANNYWCKAFGISTTSNSTLSLNPWDDNLRPNAFLGWTKSVSMNGYGQAYVEALIGDWTAPPGTSGIWELSSVTLSDAINYANNSNWRYRYAGCLRLGGYGGLTYSSWNWADEWP